MTHNYPFLRTAVQRELAGGASNAWTSHTAHTCITGHDPNAMRCYKLREASVVVDTHQSSLSVIALVVARP